MELIFVTVIGAGIGAVLRYLLPGRRHYGILLLPAVGAAVTAAIWVALVWLGWKFDGGWIWLVSLGLGGIASIIVALAASRGRVRSDARLLHHLSGGRA